MCIYIYTYGTYIWRHATAPSKNMQKPPWCSQSLALRPGHRFKMLKDPLINWYPAMYRTISWNGPCSDVHPPVVVSLRQVLPLVGDPPCCFIKCSSLLLTIWLWLTVRHGKSPFFIGKPSNFHELSMGHLFSMAILVITRGYIIQHLGLAKSGDLQLTSSTSSSSSIAASKRLDSKNHHSWDVKIVAYVDFG